MYILRQTRRYVHLLIHLLGEYANISREPKSMILCESLTQRVYTSRASALHKID